MKWNSPEMEHHTHHHAVHMPHPVQWFHLHTLALAFLLAVGITLLLVGMATLINTPTLEDLGRGAWNFIIRGE